MTPENFTDDQIRELAPEFVHKTIENFEDEPFWTLPYPGEIHTHHPDRGAFSLLLQTRLELKEARERLDDGRRFTGLLTADDRERVYEGDRVSMHQFDHEGGDIVPSVEGVLEYSDDSAAFGLRITVPGRGHDIEVGAWIPVVNFYGLHEESFTILERGPHPAPPETQAPSLAGNRTLDLREVDRWRFPPNENLNHFRQPDLIAAIRAQLPDVEVIV